MMIQYVWTLLGSLSLLLSLPIYAEKNRTVHEPDLAALLKRVMTGTYTVDPRFVEFISHPSPIYTDLYGIHALQDFTREQILNDFVPQYANLIRDGNNTFDLHFKSGWNATFYPHAILDIKGTAIPRDHVYIGGDNTEELINNRNEFHRVLNITNLQSKYLVVNPLYEMEVATNELYYSGQPTVPVTVDSDMKQFQSLPDAVMIYPDGVHGDLAAYNMFMEKLRLSNLQWLAMEMLPSTMQPILDQFCLSPFNSTDYFIARKNLTDYFFSAWTPYFRLNITSGDQSPYFQAVDLVREKKGRVYGLDLNNLEFIIFRYGESNFGASVRSRNWAMSVPLRGRGIIFGGSAHFSMNRSSNVQDFLHLRNPNLPLFLIRSLRPTVVPNETVSSFAHFFLSIFS